MIKLEKEFKAYVSITRNFLEEFPFNNSGKLATLWFDEIIFQTDSIGKVTEFVAGRDNWDSKTLKTLKKMWIPIQNYLPDIKFFDIDLIPEHPDLEETAFKITYEETKKGAEKSKFDLSDKKNFYAIMHEVGWAYMGLVESINTWILLHKNSPCVFLPIERESIILQKLFSTAMMQKPFDLFSELFNYEIQNLDSLTWEQVLETKNHDYFKHFRGKMIDIQNELNRGDKNSVFEIVNDIKMMEMEELIIKQKPVSTTKSVLKGIASNVPLPIPINPIAIYTDVKQIIEDRDIMKKYGWLYFLLDLKRI